MTTKFDINRFISKTKSDFNETEITVGFPNTAFMVAPLEDEKIEFFYIYWIHDKWWLITDDLAVNLLKTEKYTQIHLSNFWQAKLFQTISPNGDLRLLPVTYPRNGRSRSWLRAWLKNVKAGRNHFIKTYKTEDHCHDYEEVTRRHPEPQWPNLSYNKWIELAFGHCIISTMKELQQVRGQYTREDVKEED